MLGPLFYIIYANEISKIITNCGVALYADDIIRGVIGTAKFERIWGICGSKIQGESNILERFVHENGIK